LAPKTNKAAVRVLFVEDETSQREVIGDILSDEGYLVDLAADGTEALALLDKNRYQAVVTDLKMQGIDGIEVLKRVRAMNPETRVIIITGYASPDTAELAEQEGVFAFLAKPFRLDELKEVIYRAMEPDRTKA